MTLFFEAQKQKQLSTAVTLMMYLNQSMIQLYQMYKSFQEKFHLVLLIQRMTIMLEFQNKIL